MSHYTVRETPKLIHAAWLGAFVGLLAFLAAGFLGIPGLTGSELWTMSLLGSGISIVATSGYLRWQRPT